MTVFYHGVTSSTVKKNLEEASISPKVTFYGYKPTSGIQRHVNNNIKTERDWNEWSQCKRYSR